MATAQNKDSDGRFRLEVPLDASGIDDCEAGHEVKVVAQDRKGALHAETVKLDEKGQAVATLGFAEQPGALRVMVGPPDASDDEMPGLQTIALDVAARRWASEPVLRLEPIRISPYYWYWWLHWCREFTVRGVLLCPDGSPVPGAQVCAYDVDWWWVYSTNQIVGCDVTDAAGAFEIRFKWCCGWWPWWWWQHRYWQLEPALVERIAPVLQRDPGLRSLLQSSPQPSFASFEALLAEEPERARPLPEAVDPALLPALRESLLTRLPAAPELERLRIWPWWGWYPWWDCTPDIIFRATQECPEGGGVILDEGFSDARWNIPSTLDVTLVANDNACCVPIGHGCEDGECLAITHACSDLVSNIGGNILAPATPVGYQSPGVGDRPYGGFVDIYGTADCLDGVDYYEFEWATALAGPWSAMPPAASGNISHTYIQFTPLAFQSPVFSAQVPIGGRHVYETLEHFESTHPPADWGGNRLWLGSTKDWLTRWGTDGTGFADGAYYLRVKGWDLVAPDTLGNERVLRICDNEAENYVVVRIDNRVITPVGPPPLLDPRGHPCGTGTVHTCTTEPEAAILDVQILHADGTQTTVSACGNESVNNTDVLQIDFVAHDPDGHLGRYTLEAHYDVNLATNLLALGGTLAPSPAAPPWAPAAAQVGPNYAAARAAGAVSPVWKGGALRLTVQATAAFPYTCCYQLELRSHKRTIVNCDYSDWSHANFTEYSFNINV